MWDARMFSNPTYYLLSISQCCNAIGFLNLTTFLNVGLHETMGYTDTTIAFVLMGMQLADLIGRIGITAVADLLQKKMRFIRHVIYAIGVIGTGICMIIFQFIKTDAEVMTLVLFMGLFSRYDTFSITRTAQTCNYLINFLVALLLCGTR